MSSSAAAAAVAAAASAGGDDIKPTPGDGEEGILVAVRMRPLNAREQAEKRRCWRVLKKNNSIAQITRDGKPLPERQAGHNFFQFDKTFGEKTTTRQVYDHTSRGIVKSVASGLNGTIFAYGQTSSGKTFTMQGAGTLEDGAVSSSPSSGGGSPRSGQENDGGIVHMAASDIFNHIETEPDRVFLIRVSFMEIYNEEVRDLLVSGDRQDATLVILEDKRRGVFVNSNETIVTSMDSMLSVFFAGEKNRRVAATGMNERSSRSHAIFRITVESRPKQQAKKSGDDDHDVEDSDDEGDLRGDDNANGGAVRLSTLNLVDLAGSESVKHTGATGDRQKEGGKINQSLLTLSRVIQLLGTNATHVNFRDSKLTRILKPSLSGNARMAIICCATPSELYMEETRYTLQFAQRAKLVKTRAQVNEVMDDRSLIKKLQRELKEARKGGPGKEATEQMKALEEKAASAEVANRALEEDLKRMKELILKGGVLPGTVGTIRSAVQPSLCNALFVYNDNDETITTGADKFSLSKSRKGKSKRRYSDGVINETENVDPQQNGSFASPARGGNVAKMQAQTEMKPKKAKPSAHILPSDMTDDVDIGLLREALAAKSAQAASLKAKLKEAEQQAQAAAKKFQHEHQEKEHIWSTKKELESQVEGLAEDKEFVLQEQDIVMAELRDAKVAAEERVTTLESTLEAERQAAAAKLADVEGRLEEAQSANSQMTEQVSSLVNTNNDATNLLKEKDSALEGAQSTIATLKDESSSATNKLLEEMTELREAKTAAEERARTLEGNLEKEMMAAADEGTTLNNAKLELEQQVTALEKNLEAEQATVQELEHQVTLAENDVVRLSKENNCSNELIESLQTNLSDATVAKEEQDAALQDAIQSLQAASDAKDDLNRQLSELQTKYDLMNTSEEGRKENVANLEASLLQKDQYYKSQITSLETERDDLMNKIESMTQELAAQSSTVEELQSKVAELNANYEAAEERVTELTSKLDSSEETKEAQQREKDDLLVKFEEATSQLKATESERDECLNEIELALNAHDQSTREIEQLKHQVSEASSKISDLTDQLSTVSAEKERLEEEVTEIQGEADSQIITISMLQASIEQVSAERDASNQQITELLSANKDAEGVLDSLKAEKNELASTLEQSKADIARLRTEKSSSGPSKQRSNPPPSTVAHGSEVSVASQNNAELASRNSTKQSVLMKEPMKSNKEKSTQISGPSSRGLTDSNKLVAPQNKKRPTTLSANKPGVLMKEASKPNKEPSTQNVAASSISVAHEKHHLACEKHHSRTDDTSSKKSSNVKTKKSFIDFSHHRAEELSLPFPVGCPVWFQFENADDSNGQSFHTGTITAVLMEVLSREVFYKVKPTGASSESAEMLTEKNLCYAPKCPVNIATSTPDTPFKKAQGEILMCQSVSKQQVAIQSVQKLKESLLRETGQSNSQDNSGKILNILDQLDEIEMHRPILSETLVGRTVKKLVKKPRKGAVAEKADELVKKWRVIADKEVQQGPTAENSSDDICFFYTVLVIKEGNQFHVEENVASNRITHRNLALSSGGEYENESSNYWTNVRHASASPKKPPARRTNARRKHATLQFPKWVVSR